MCPLDLSSVLPSSLPGFVRFVQQLEDSVELLLDIAQPALMIGQLGGLFGWFAD